MNKTMNFPKLFTLLIAFSGGCLFTKTQVIAIPKPAVLIELERQGQLLYRPNRNANYIPAYQNMELPFTYHLWLKPGGSAAILCPSNSSQESIIKDIPEAKMTVANLGCPEIISDIFDTLRGGDDPNIPFIISPRNTALSSNKPTIRWQALPNIKDYQVTLSSNNGEVWSISSTSVDAQINPSCPNFPLSFIEIDYPTNQPPLEHGKEYQIIVTAEKEIDPTEDCDEGWHKRENNPFKCYTSSTFEYSDRVKPKPVKLLEASYIEMIKNVETEYQQQLQGVSQTLAIAHLYEANNLNLEAIKILENLVAKEPQTASIYRFLGDLYQKIQLDPVAEAYYNKTIKLAEEEENLTEQATALWRLSKILYVNNKRSEAQELATKARDIYKQLGDQNMIEQIDEQLDE